MGFLDIFRKKNTDVTLNEVSKNLSIVDKLLESKKTPKEWWNELDKEWKVRLCLMNSEFDRDVSNIIEKYGVDKSEAEIIVVGAHLDFIENNDFDMGVHDVILSSSLEKIYEFEVFFDIDKCILREVENSSIDVRTDLNIDVSYLLNLSSIKLHSCNLSKIFTDSLTRLNSLESLILNDCVLENFSFFRRLKN